MKTWLKNTFRLTVLAGGLCAAGSALASLPLGYHSQANFGDTAPGSTSAPQQSVSYRTLLQAVNALYQESVTIDKDVKAGNQLSLDKWNQSIKNKTAAGALLMPVSMNFLWNQNGYQSAQDWPVLGQISSSAVQTMLGSNANDNPAYQLFSNEFQANDSGQDVYTQQAQAVTSGYQQLSSQLTNWGSSNLPNTDQQGLNIAQYVLSQIAGDYTPDTQDQLPSLMQSLHQAVTAPLSATPDPTTNKTWFEALSTASTPQLLRSMAVLMAERNYLAYQNLRQAQMHNALAAAQVAELAEVSAQLQNSQQQQQAWQQNYWPSMGALFNKRNGL